MHYRIVMIFDRGRATTGHFPESLFVLNNEYTSPSCDGAFFSEAADNPSDERPSNTQNLCQLLMCHGEFAGVRSIDGGQQPFRCPLGDRVRGVASRGLEDLCQKAVRISGKPMP